MDIPTEPILFSKYPSTLIGHQAEIVLPAVSDQVDYEAELVLVIGRKGRHIPASRPWSTWPDTPSATTSPHVTGS